MLHPSLCYKSPLEEMTTRIAAPSRAHWESEEAARVYHGQELTLWEPIRPGPSTTTHRCAPGGSWLPMVVCEHQKPVPKAAILVWRGARFAAKLSLHAGRQNLKVHVNANPRMHDAFST